MRGRCCGVRFPAAVLAVNFLVVPLVVAALTAVVMIPRLVPATH